MLVTAHTFASASTWTPQAGLTEGFDRPSGANSATGQSIAGNYQLQALAGASGTKRSTAAANADVGNTHILALRRFVPNVPPTVSLTSPANGATFTAPANITLSATAADSDGTIQKVEFFHGGTNLIGTVTVPPYTMQWTAVPQGAYALTAVATDNGTATTTSTPVIVTVAPAVVQVYFIEVDHLNTPRVVSNATSTTVWRWDQLEPFGVNVPDENPSGLGAFEFPMRFPGQYYDRETNLHYNYRRDYDPAIGRYIQSDPIGLDGGVSTYGYAYGNPISFKDPTGLITECELYALRIVLNNNQPSWNPLSKGDVGVYPHARGKGSNFRSGGSIYLNSISYAGSVVDRGLSIEFLLTGAHENAHRNQDPSERSSDKRREDRSGGEESHAQDEADRIVTLPMVKEFEELVKACRKCKGNDPTVWFRF